MHPRFLVPMLALAALPAMAAAPSHPCEHIDPDQREADAHTTLSQGYAQLYEAASGLRLLDNILMAKSESAETRQVIEKLSKYAGRLRGELERIAKENPRLSLEDDGLPRIERDKRRALARDRAKTLAPLIGAGGADFERTLLLTQSGALNNLRFLAQALADAEIDKSRRKYLLGVRDELDRLYREVVALLDRRFFKAPADTPLGAAGRSS